MAITVSANEVATNGVTPVTVVPAPGVSQINAIPSGSIGAVNTDTISHIFIWQKDKAGVKTIVQRDANVGVNERSKLDKQVALNATDETFELVLGEAHGSAASRADALYLNIS